MKRYIPLLIVVVLVVTSCVEEISLDPKERIVVVECVLENSETQSVSLRYSSYLSENNYPFVEEAYVRIDEYKKGQYRYIKDKEYKFRKTEEGVWKANFTPKANCQYKLIVLIPEKDSITATTLFFYGGVMDAIDSLYNNMGGEEWGPDRTLTIEDTNSTLFPSCRMGQIFPRPGRFFFWVYGMDYDPIKDKYKQADLITIPYHDSYYQLAIENSFYNFLDFFNVLDIKRGEVEEFKYPANPGVKFPEILEYGFPQYMHGSYNGASNSMHYKYLRLTNSYDYQHPKPEGWASTLTNVFATQMHIAVNFKQYKYGVAHPKSYLVFMAVNTDYDKYLKDVVAYEVERLYTTETDLTNIYDLPSPIYTNIKNGKGIFGARYINTIPYQDYKSVIYNGTTYNKTKNLEETP